MGEGNGDWLRVRGIGRERFAGYLGDYLATLGYAVQRDDLAERNESRLTGRLERPNPAVPPSAAALEFRFYPTSGGAAVVWEAPAEMPTDQRGRMDRLVREISSHLERAISTESHAAAKVVRPSTSRLPWEPAPPNGGATSHAGPTAGAP
ncbi:MAG TPA: hypothetical protein VMH49_07950 [Thermoplasmata archaeon]|nr:hypothetical protein [Thermoplasmata archaeon]